MTSQQIISFREKSKENNKQIFIYTDNSLIFYDGLRDMEYLIWDDDNEVVTVFGPIRENFTTNSLYRRSETPYEMYTFSYQEIQGMGVYMNFNNLKIEIEGMVDKGLITLDKANQMLKSMAPLSRANVSPITRTMKTYSEKDYKEYKEEKRKSDSEEKSK